jgi:ribose 5-phosphate isomerase B
MKIFIGADHNGYHMREKLIEYLRRAGYDVIDSGDTIPDPKNDFPVFAQNVVHKMAAHGLSDSRGILLCGSGQGMCMAANRFIGIRAALGFDRESVRSARNDDDANILCLPAGTIDLGTAKLIVDTFLNTSFAASPRFKRRIKELDEMGS